jgi:cation diffusion facilitator CzcD-associated flavoprotein CzcO
MDGEGLKGVYAAFDADAVYALEGCDAVVVGTAAAARCAVDTLATRCRCVVWIASRTGARGTPSNVRVLRDAELLVIAGLTDVECVLIRQMRSGRVLALNAAAVFVLSDDSPSLHALEKRAQP